MPIYSFRDKSTGEEFEKMFSYNEKVKFLEEENVEEVFYPVQLGYNYSTRKIDDGFNDVLKRIKKGSPGSTISTK